MNKHLVIHPGDNVGVALVPLGRGTVLPIGGGLALADDIPAGHKFALGDIAADTDLVKYGVAIGHATRAIRRGEWVHTHNLNTNLGGEVEYRYEPVGVGVPSGARAVDNFSMFQGYRRANGRVGIRNELWVVPMVGCVNRLAERLAAAMNTQLPEGVGPAVAFPHPHGCSQLGGDHENTRTLLANLASHPNAGGVLFIGLGCENNTIQSFNALVADRPDANPNRDQVIAQDEEDEFAVGLARLRALADRAATARREPVPVSALKVGLKCGGSDGLSGITANPLFGAFSDWLVDRGGATVLTEVPEMFGAEKSLLNRAVNADIFRRGVDMVNDFKRYFQRHGQTIYENPSPGNKDGGISTLEDKSLGCTQKGGSRAVVDVLPYGGQLRVPGVTLLSGPGNDIVTVSLLAASGVQLILFSTGRGTPLGGPVPVVKVSTQSELARRKAGWIDFNAGPLAEDEALSGMLERFIATILAVANGQSTRNENAGARDFAIFKDGVTL